MVFRGALKNNQHISIEDVGLSTTIYFKRSRSRVAPKYLSTYMFIFLKINFCTSTFDELIYQLQSDHRRRTKIEEPLAINILNTTGDIEQSTTKLNGRFIQSQLMIDCLLRMTSHTNNVNGLTEFCENIYERNQSQLSIVHEFKDKYSRSNALWWYTRDCFLYRILNKALRTDNIDILFLFCPIIYDIHHQLTQYQCKSKIQVYRGQLMSTSEVNNLKESIGQCISISSYLSTSLDRQLAMFFLGDSSPLSGLHRILFEIDADPCMNAKPFAEISAQSAFTCESEVLFQPGSIFRLTHIEYNDEQVYTIRMELCHESASKNLLKFMANEYQEHETSIRNLGILLRKTGKIYAAEKFYHDLLRSVPLNDPSIGVLYHNVGVLAIDKGNYDIGLEWLIKSLKINLHNSLFDPVILSKTLNGIGVCHIRKSNYKLALEFLNKAAFMLKQIDDEDHLRMAWIYNNIGVTYEKQMKHSLARRFYKRCLAIEQKYLPNYHPDLGRTFNNMGVVYKQLGHYDLALKYFDIAIKIYLKSLFTQHPDIGLAYQNMGNVLICKNQCLKALECWIKALNIFHNCLPSDHPNIVQIKQTIKTLIFILQ